MPGGRDLAPGPALARGPKVTRPMTDPHIPPHWDARFLALAGHVAAWSKHRTTRVGCVVVDDDRRIRATGFNGFPRGVADAPGRLADRPTKLLLSVHAEANAVAAAARAGVPLAGCTAYVTHPPCAACAALLTQAGIRRVVFRGRLRDDWADSEAAARLIMAEAGVACVPPADGETVRVSGSSGGPDPCLDWPRAIALICRPAGRRPAIGREVTS
jgi:dCMP deaminase